MASRERLKESQAPPPKFPVRRERLRRLQEPETTIDDFFLKDRAIQFEKRRVRKSLGMSVSATPIKKRSYYDRLKVDLYRAGVDAEPSRVIKLILYLAIVALVVGAAVIGGVALYHLFPFGTIVLYLLVWSVLGFVALYSLAVLLLKVYLSYRVFRRKMEVEQVLPEFLRLVATNYRSGMPLDEALIKSNRPRFGIFSKEIELVAKTTKVKGDLAKSLEIFSKKFDSKILQRAMNNIVMSVRSGSNISELLEEIANNITKMRNMRVSMAANVKNYIIFIIVAGVIIAPLMFSMSYTMNTTIAGVKAGMDVSSMSTAGQGLLNVQSEGGVDPGDFNVFALLMLITNSFVSAFVISMLRYGNFQQGIKRIPVFLAISVALYFLGKWVLSLLLMSTFA
ncbi:type II secretion system F family protein [Candidatus Woesearchaeota archaeon]|nr:type II secretion system F family protein [Candidatus Woesearchaeota archaeon]